MPTPSVTSAPYVPPTSAPVSAPIDPATASGARQDPNYISSTNFANLQKQYTPYQIDQATERRGSDIFWKSGVNIASVPTVAPTTSFVPPSEKPPIPASVVGSSTPPLTSPNPSNAEYDARNKAAASYLAGMQSTIDNIQKQQEARLAEQKATQEATVKGLKDKLTEVMGSTDYQTSLQKDRELFNTKQKIEDLGVIQTKIADAQNALNQGLIFEEGRPTRMELLTGRSAELKKQGLAQIQSLQSTAEIIKGNIDLARAYAQDSIDAIKMDNDKKIGALNTLLDLENKSLINISDEEKATIKERMNNLSAEGDRIAAEKDKLFNLASKYPQAFSKGGVTFKDTMDSAYQKMLPYLSEQQQTELDKAVLENKLLSSQISKNNADAAKARSGGSGGESESSILEQARAAVQEMVRLKNAGDERFKDVSVDQIIQDANSRFGAKVKDQAQLKFVVENAAGKTGVLSDADMLRNIQLRDALAKEDAISRGLVTRLGDPSPQSGAIRDAIGKGLIEFNSDTGKYRVIGNVNNYTKGHEITPADIGEIESKWSGGYNINR